MVGMVGMVFYHFICEFALLIMYFVLYICRLAPISMVDFLIDFVACYLLYINRNKYALILKKKFS